MAHSTYNPDERLNALSRRVKNLESKVNWCDKHAVAQPCQFCPDERIVRMLGEETTLRSNLQTEYYDFVRMTLKWARKRIDYTNNMATSGDMNHADEALLHDIEITADRLKLKL